MNAVRSAVEIRGALAGAQESDRTSPDAVRAAHRGRYGAGRRPRWRRGQPAARIQAAAEPDSIYVSAAFFDHVRRNSAFIFDDIGERAFRNISEPVHLYRVRGEMGPHRLQSAPTQLVAAKLRRPSSITVLPFRVSGGDDDQRYLAEGLTEELIVELGRFKRLSVSSRSASFSVAESKPDPVKVGDLLGVHYVLEGQLRRIGPRLSISLTLSETENGSVVWSGKISKPFEELFELVEKTTAKIGATVFGRIDEAGMVAARRKPPDNMTAFDYLLRGLDHHRRGGVTDDNARQAVAWFTKAIDADPNYAAAYAWRVCAGSWLGDFDLEQGRRDVCRALELDPCDAEANRIMGVVALMDRNFDEALAHHRRAMELNPTDAYIKARCAAVFTFVGEAERALSLLDEAEMLDPFLPVWCIEERGVALCARPPCRSS